MEKLIKLTAAVLITVFAVACGASRKEDATNPGDKKAALESLKKERDELNSKITKLEIEISKTDSTVSTEKAKLVAVTSLHSENFDHYVDLQGKSR